MCHFSQSKYFHSDGGNFVQETNAIYLIIHCCKLRCYSTEAVLVITTVMITSVPTCDSESSPCLLITIN